ncbi:MAG: hypothetical protein KDA32_11705, partial [Phycisphaerales bacterium]|nr:hypothetical protein [Phycisphaerales bacterium]
NWIQDDLPNLFGPGRGAGVTPFDVIFGSIGMLRARQSGYPAEQICVAPVPVNPRRFHDRPVSGDERARYACDVSFVSNHSIAPEAFIEQASVSIPPEQARLLRAIDEDFAARIARDDVPATQPRTNALILQIAQREGIDWMTLDHCDALRRAVVDKLITLRFRQEALEAVSGMGLELRLYGNGWENHPRLARYARGPAAHGDELRAIYQATRVNLQLMPTGAIHQRLIEGLFSGGFFLIRRTAADTCGDVYGEIEAYCLQNNIESDLALIAAADTDRRVGAHLERLRERLFAPGEPYDGLVADFELARARGFPLDARGLLPRYDDVAFGTTGELAALLNQFLHDEAARREIAGPQRSAVNQHFSYDAALKRMFDFAAAHFARLAAKTNQRSLVSAIDS